MGYLEDSLTLEGHLPIGNFYVLLMQILGIYTACVTSYISSTIILPLSVCPNSTREAQGSTFSTFETRYSNIFLSILERENAQS